MRYSSLGSAAVHLDPGEGGAAQSTSYVGPIDDGMSLWTRKRNLIAALLCMSMLLLALLRKF